MKRSITFRLAVAALALAAAGSTAAQGNRRPCTVDWMNGTYVFSASGFVKQSDGTWAPKAITEFFQLNGNGTLSVLGATANIAGSTAQTPPNTVGGTYTMNYDCRGTLSFGPPGPSFDIYASSQGEDIWMIQTNPGNVLQGNATRVSH